MRSQIGRQRDAQAMLERDDAADCLPDAEGDVAYCLPAAMVDVEAQAGADTKANLTERRNALLAQWNYGDSLLFT